MSKTTDKGIACAAGIYRADFKCRDMHFLSARHPQRALLTHGHNNIVEAFSTRRGRRHEYCRKYQQAGRLIFPARSHWEQRNHIYRHKTYLIRATRAPDLITLQCRAFTKFDSVVNRFQLNLKLQHNQLAFFKSSAARSISSGERNLLAPLIIRMLLLELAFTKIGATPLLVQGTFST